MKISKPDMDSKGAVKGSFREVAPGVLVNSNFTVSVPHPDPCFVLMDLKKVGVIAVDERLLIFSNPEAAHKFLKNTCIEGAFIVETLPWGFLVDQCGCRYKEATLDQTGEEGFFQNIPLCRS